MYLYNHSTIIVGFSSRLCTDPGQIV